jgi:pSer/pThr/pTyr-binding forkhead associated (FHA) protein
MEGAEKHEGDLAPAARAEPPADASRAPAGGYEVPEWGGPSSADFSLEVLKDGAIVDVVDCRGRGCVTLGRTPDNDVVLEHPSSSRTHAVIQFARGGAEAFVFDNASTHGTFVNKRRLKARVHAPVFVGDQIRFGQSSRVFVVAGASELMPEEGLSRDERRRLRALEKMSEAERTRSSGSSGAHGLDASSRDARGGGDWGMDDEDDRPSESALKLAALDWRDHAGALSEKQEKQKEKIRRKEEKARALRTESERISAKESESTPLTQGQRVTLARNESALEKLEEEIEDADEALNESIRASLGGAAAKTRGARPRRDVAGSDSEDARGSDSDDDFYDRTASATARRQKKEQRRKQAREGKEGNRRGRGLNESENAPVAVETAATLWEKKSVAAAALEASKATLAEAEARSKAARSNRALPSGGVEGDAGDVSNEKTENDGEAPDDLDAFMITVARARDEEATADATKRVAEKEAELARLDRLLRLADPRGEFAPGSDMQRSVERLAEAARARLAADEQSARRRIAAKAQAQAARAAAEAERARLAEWEKRGELTAKRAFSGSGANGANGGGVAAAPASADQATAAANAALPVGVSTAQERKKRAAAVPESTAVPANRSVPASARSIDGGSSGVPLGSG